MAEVVKVTDKKSMVRLLREVVKGNTFALSPIAIGRLNDIEARLDSMLNDLKEKVSEMINEIAKDVTAMELQDIIETAKSNGNMNKDMERLIALYKIAYDRIVYLKISMALATKLMMDTLSADEFATVMASLKMMGIDGEEAIQLLNKITGENNKYDNRDVF